MGQTALHKAAQWGRIYDMKALLEGGASVNVTDTSGYTPLHILCQSKVFYLKEKLFIPGQILC